MKEETCLSEILIENLLLGILSKPVGMDEFKDSIMNFFKQNFSPAAIDFFILQRHENLPKGKSIDDISLRLLDKKCGTQQLSCRDLPPDQLPEAFIQSDSESAKPLHRYCLPLWADSHPIGIIVLDLPAPSSFSSETIKFLKRLARIITLKYLLVEANDQMIAHKLQHENDLRHISQDLHDTIGQSIGFIRLKMEQVRYDFPSRRYPEISQELDRIQEVTEEAYRQVRGLLAELHPTSSLDLTTAISSQAYFLAERAGFNFSITEIGTPYPLPPLVKRQLLYIFREALTNVEKHAQACQVNLDIFWGESDCSISLQDNGIGFITSVLPPPDHYGLVIMQERASDISARFILESSPGHGTKVTIIVPVA